MSRRPPDQVRAWRRGRAVLRADLHRRPDEPATWKILRPGPAATEHLYATRRSPAPAAARLQPCLSPITGSAHAADLARAVDPAPPPAAAWIRSSDAG